MVVQSAPPALRIRSARPVHVNWRSSWSAAALVHAGLPGRGTPSQNTTPAHHDSPALLSCSVAGRVQPPTACGATPPARRLPGGTRPDRVAAGDTRDALRAPLRRRLASALQPPRHRDLPCRTHTHIHTPGHRQHHRRPGSAGPTPDTRRRGPCCHTDASRERHTGAPSLRHRGWPAERQPQTAARRHPRDHRPAAARTAACAGRHHPRDHRPAATRTLACACCRCGQRRGRPRVERSGPPSPAGTPRVAARHRPSPSWPPPDPLGASAHREIPTRRRGSVRCSTDARCTRSGCVAGSGVAAHAPSRRCPPEGAGAAPCT